MFVQVQSSVDPQPLLIRMLFLFLLRGGRLSQGRGTDLFLRRRGRAEDSFVHLLILNRLRLRTVNAAKAYLGGGTFSAPSTHGGAVISRSATELHLPPFQVAEKRR